MVNRSAAILTAVLVIATFAAGAWAITQLAPDARVAIHFDSLGRPNGFAAPSRAFMLIPLVALALWGVFAVIPRIDPRGANIARSGKAYGAIWIAVIVVLAIVQGSLIARAFGVALPAHRLAMALLGMTFIVIGNVMGKIRPNYSIGIRTRWTLSDEHVWDKTHRFAGWAFVAGGIVLAVASVTLPAAAPTVAAILGVTAAVVAATTLKSWLLWRARH